MEKVPAQVRSSVHFSCPVCSEPNIVSLEDVEDYNGLVECSDCGTEMELEINEEEAIF